VIPGLRLDSLELVRRQSRFVVPRTFDIQDSACVATASRCLTRLFFFFFFFLPTQKGFTVLQANVNSTTDRAPIAMQRRDLSPSQTGNVAPIQKDRKLPMRLAKSLVTHVLAGICMGHAPQSGLVVWFPISCYGGRKVSRERVLAKYAPYIKHRFLSFLPSIVHDLELELPTLTSYSSEQQRLHNALLHRHHHHHHQDQQHSQAHQQEM
jgi:hypothetical protein